jgi:hypothetical protein
MHLASRVALLGRAAAQATAMHRAGHTCSRYLMPHRGPVLSERRAGGAATLLRVQNSWLWPSEGFYASGITPPAIPPLRVLDNSQTCTYSLAGLFREYEFQSESKCG